MPKKTHKVVSGDTMYKISKEYGVRLGELINYNPHIKNPNRIYPGDMIYIPIGSTGNSWLESGYKLERVIDGLTFPIAMTFNDKGEIFIGESGFAYGPVYDTARIIRLNRDGTKTEIARGFLGPLTSITWHNGYFYVAEGGYPGKITKVTPLGEKLTLLDDLQSGGDHFTSEIVFGPDGKMYFGIGTATNSGVVGIDNMSWVKDLPFLYDIRCEDTIVTGRNFKTPNPLTEDEADKAITGSFRPFGVPVAECEVIRGEIPCKGAIMRANPDGTELEVVANGLRNPFGLRFNSEGELYAVDHGMDERGSRPVDNDWDYLWRIENGGWYGWPDFRGGIPIIDPMFQVEGGPKLHFLMAEHPPLAEPPVAIFDHHSASMKLDFSTNSNFGYLGEAFVAEFGTMFPVKGQPGKRVVRVNPETGAVNDFFIKGSRGIGPERPVAVYFDPSGECLYVVDFGKMTQGHNEGEGHGHAFAKKTGAVWKIYRAY